MSEPAPRIPQPPTQATAAQTASGVLTLSVFVVVVAALYLARDVLLPLTLAVLLSIILSPIVFALRRAGIGRVPSVMAAVIVALGIILAIGGLIGTQFVELSGNIPTYARTIQAKADGVRLYVAESEFGDIFRGASDHPAGANPPVKQPPRSSNAPDALSAAGAATGNRVPIPVEVHEPDPSPLQLAKLYLTPILSPIGTAGIVFVVAIFILLQQEDLRDRLIRLFGSYDLRRTTVALDDGGRRLSRYFLTQLGINVAFGTVIGIGLAVIGVPSPLLWAVMAGLLRFVPYIGAFISASFPMFLAAAIDPGWSMVIWTGLLFATVEGMVGQAVEPLVFGHSTGLSPVSIVVAAIFWSWLWGPVGLILSTPLTLCLAVLGRHVDRLKFLDVILGDKPALTPVEGFYQRMLSGDQDEARYHAEQMLKDRSLTEYYDEVALPGLELAAIDAQRGMLNTEQLDRIKETIKELVTDLSDYADLPNGPDPDDKTDPGESPEEPARGPANPHFPVIVPTPLNRLTASWYAGAQVLCVAGRGPLDEAASAMLCQLLDRHGIASRTAPYASVTRGNINSLDVENVEIVCISYLDISGRQAHLRYLLQRLRQRLPEVPMLVGIWPENQPGIRDRNLQAFSGSEYYLSSLRETVETCFLMTRTDDFQDEIKNIA